MLGQRVDLLSPALIAQVTGAKPVQVQDPVIQKPSDRFIL
jgi:hypothetical protein